MMPCLGLLVIPLEGGALEGGALEGGALEGGVLEGGVLEGGVLKGGVLEEGAMLVVKTGGTTNTISSTVVVQSIQHALSLRGIV